MKLAIAQLTMDRMELVEQSAKPLRAAASHPHSKFHWYIIDGSQKEESEKRLFEIAYPTANFRSNVRGGAGAASADRWWFRRVIRAQRSRPSGLCRVVG